MASSLTRPVVAAGFFMAALQGASAKAFLTYCFPYRVLGSAHYGTGGYGLRSGAAVNAFMVFYLFNRGTSIILMSVPFQIPVQIDRQRGRRHRGCVLLLSGFSLFFMVQLLGLGSGFSGIGGCGSKPMCLLSLAISYGFFRNQLSPLEAPPGRKEVPGLHAQAQPGPRGLF